MRIRKTLLLSWLFLAGTANVLAASKFTDEVLRNRREQTPEEQVWGESNRGFLERNLEGNQEPGEGGVRSAPGSRGWPPQRSDPIPTR